MSDKTYQSSCDVLMNPGVPDRFFMDMSVYEVREWNALGDDTDPDALIWRGLYLAITVPPAEHSAGRGNNPFKQFLN
jgi:hypothetical protein